ncbi:MAG: hypothetical protein ABI904_11000 [Chloroflexota bacterium]
MKIDQAELADKVWLFNQKQVPAKNEAAFYPNKKSPKYIGDFHACALERT